MVSASAGTPPSQAQCHNSGRHFICMFLFFFTFLLQIVLFGIILTVSCSVVIGLKLLKGLEESNGLLCMFLVITVKCINSVILYGNQFMQSVWLLWC